VHHSLLSTVIPINKDVLPQRTQSTQRKAGDREKHPERWSGEIRNWDMIDEVYLNPGNEKNKVA